MTYLCLPAILEGMRTTIRMNDELLRRAKKLAAEEGRTLTSIIEEGVTRVLSAKARPLQNRVDIPISKKRGGVRPGIDINNYGQLLDIMEGHDVTGR